MSPYLLVYQKLDSINNVPSLYNAEVNNRPNIQSNFATNAVYQVHTLFENSKSSQKTHSKLKRVYQSREPTEIKEAAEEKPGCTLKKNELVKLLRQ